MSPFFALRARTLTMAFLALATLLQTAGSAAAQTLSLAPDQWQLSPTGAFEAWTDRRGLLVLHHPWAVSEKGFAATAGQTVTIPEDWETPVRLHFYMSDDYDGSMPPVSTEWLGQINLPGHRFKEVLVDGQVVWREDVADSADTGVPAHFSVTLPEVQPGSTIALAFRLSDEAGSMERLPGDHRYIGTTDNIAEADPWKFMTHLYVGDVTLVSGAVTESSRGVLPSIASGLAAPEAKATNGIAYPVGLSVRHGSAESGPRVLQCGVPFAQGVLQDTATLRLTTTTGEAIPVSAAPMTRWADGSIRLARLTALLPAGSTQVLLDFDSDTPIPAPNGATPQATVAADDNGATVLHLTRGARQLSGLRGVATIGDDMATFVADDVRLIEESTLHREQEATGFLRSATRNYGRCSLRLTTFTGQPWVRLFFRVFNDTPETLEVTRLALEASWNGAAESLGTAGLEWTGSRGRIAQIAADSWQAQTDTDAPATHAGMAPPWLGVTGADGGMVAIVRHLAEQFPNALNFQEGALSIELFAPADGIPAYTPHEGEAKRFELWLGLWDEAIPLDIMAGAAADIAMPAGLFDAVYFCATGAFGNAAPYGGDRHPELAAFMKQTYGDIPASMFYHTGIRHFGDLPYSVEEGTWRNGYYDAQQGLFSAYLIDGNDRWFDHLEASVRHIIDVDICHASAAHPDWVGAIHGLYSKDHSTGDPWNPTQRTKGTINYWRLTGDRDALNAALGVADSAVASGRAMGSVSVRDHAGVLYCLVAAYDETREAKYLDAARALAHDAMTRIDPRRGTYAEIHGNYSYRGNVPWMVAQLMEPMYDYYRASGDADAGAAVVSMAESILAENRTRGVPGDVNGYSHNPHFAKHSGYHILIAPAVLYAYELTGDPEFLKQGRALYAQTIAEGTVNSVLNCFWNTHTLLYYLERYAEVQAP